MPGWTVTLATLVITVGRLAAAVGVVWKLQTTRPSPHLMQIICSLPKGFQPEDTIRIVQPPNNGTRTMCRFPSPCLSNRINDTTTYGQRNTTLSLIFTPENSGLYSCLYNEEHGAVASEWLTVVEPVDTTTTSVDTSTAGTQDTSPTADHDTTTTALNSSTADTQGTSPTADHVSGTSRSLFILSASGIWVTCLGLIVYQCA